MNEMTRTQPTPEDLVRSAEDDLKRLRHHAPTLRMVEAWIRRALAAEERYRQSCRLDLAVTYGWAAREAGHTLAEHPEPMTAEELECWQKGWHWCDDHLGRPAGEAFKRWVHGWLDGIGVPHDPDRDHTAQTGCRISGRLLCQQLEIARDERDQLRQDHEVIGHVIGCNHVADGLARCVRETVEGLQDEVARLRDAVAGAA